MEHLCKDSVCLDAFFYRSTQQIGVVLVFVSIVNNSQLAVIVTFIS